MWHFYILQSQKEPDYFYKGSTGDLKNRLKLHNGGEVKSTKLRRTWNLVYYEAFVSEKAARLRESSVKRSGSVSVPLSKRINEGLRN
ncbi:hypothetical protein COV06_00465 [Candidatus Uhrbacteria bacterium CG10_big_fil_rev_8_21_14_0_10_50_16]|uniref:GIY-YIG domain-containing protein n=1 Tax=Candidatus Uhrbacteria bacterium CG10_big_fil_rev_8_21_14_0_10_50_16 TaxID=1975039 RepID=A0A2H0RMT1_9BACT|nr:MAG: hypothetical protein COV06_00465 [Candidatus Uhrbacteria bacterium CG10_big_fil_rev_8_21_14_0_10_50_16]